MINISNNSQSLNPTAISTTPVGFSKQTSNNRNIVSIEDIALQNIQKKTSINIKKFFPIVSDLLESQLKLVQNAIISVRNHLTKTSIK